MNTYKIFYFLKGGNNKNELSCAHTIYEFKSSLVLLGKAIDQNDKNINYAREGAFKSNISEFKPNDLMISLNTGITIWKWIEAYFDYGLFKNKNEPILTGFDSGFRLNIVENYFELFFPIYSSEDFYINKKSYSNRILLNKLK